MTRFRVTVDNLNYEVESVFNNIRNITQFEIFVDGKKQFTIEPKIIYGQGKEILWTAARGKMEKRVDPSVIENIGSAIESLINQIF